jgi:hypothetical protein
MTRDVKATVSASGSPASTDDELLALRVRNKILSEALESIQKSASEELKRRFDLVWFAKYRCKYYATNWETVSYKLTSFPSLPSDRYPNHPDSKRIDTEYKKDIEKLRGGDGDYFHGFNTGLLAAARLFKELADCLNVNNFDRMTSDLIEESSKHKEKLREAATSFPQIEVTNDFPKSN